jgi:hypothetical protein
MEAYLQAKSSKINMNKLPLKFELQLLLNVTN